MSTSPEKIDSVELMQTLVNVTMALLQNLQTYEEIIAKKKI